ncbi:Os01g0281250 [Oryza sativa Japonica Group]|uniref:Os01g0281250 protein n=1 Tax=Oryza sativa subsp. japonica TaxID=39947 RepID=A0A0P0V119_ORYSJ|nr:hypothetical protein EE612_001836 [Oryza sativa]BAS71600.1 Os01g0281250 [Oryza sativa Japonica Group]
MAQKRAWSTEPVRALRRRKTTENGLCLLVTSSSPNAAFRYRRMNMYIVGTVRFHWSLLSMDFSVLRTCCLLKEFGVQKWNPYQWSPSLLILAGYQHGAYTDKLQLLPGHILQGQVLINYVDSEVQCLWHQHKPVVHFDEPISQDCSHSLVDLGL